MPHWVRLQFLRRHLELPDDSQSISLLHRLSIIYLSLPLAIWLLGWFHWWFSLPVVAVLIAALWPFMANIGRREYAAVREWMENRRARRARRSETRRQRRRRLQEERLRGVSTEADIPWWGIATIVIILIVAAVLVIVSGAGGWADVTNSDWNKHRGVFSAVASWQWPVHVPTRDDLPDPMLRYYLGYYMVPSALSKLLGEEVLKWLIGLWTWVGISLGLLIFAKYFSRWGVLAAVAIFVLFSGMDVFRWIVPLGSDLFVAFGLEWNEGAIDMQFIGTTANVLWSPQHLIPAVIVTFMLIQLWQNQKFLAASGVIVVMTAFWSPFVALGLLPFAGLIALHQGIRPFLTWQNVAVSIPLAALIALYLVSNIGDVERGWLWERHEWSELAAFLPHFFLAEFGILAALLLLLAPELRRSGLFIVAIAMPVLLSFYTYGIFNDLYFRTVLPASLIIAFFAVALIIDSAGRISLMTIRQRSLLALVVIVLAIGVISPYVEVRRSITTWSDYAFPWGTEPPPADAFEVIEDETYFLYSGRPPEQFQALLRQ